MRGGGGEGERERERKREREREQQATTFTPGSKYLRVIGFRLFAG